MSSNSVGKSIRTIRNLPGIGLIYFLCSIFVIIIVISCSYQTDQQIRRIPLETRDIASLSLPFTPVKIAYSSLDNSVYVMEPKTNLIHIYRNGEHFNTVGGLGFSENNFSRLSDITVSPHGRLLALDSFQKQIKKFDSNGMWIENYSIRQLNEPVLFDVSHDGMVFVFDRTSNEIVIFDEQIENVVFQFGKFMFRDPFQLTCTFSHVTVNDGGSNKSFIFDNYGRFIVELNGFWQIDRFSNKYRLEVNKIIHPVTNRDFLLSHSPWQSFFVKSGYLALIREGEIRISEIIYERN